MISDFLLALTIFLSAVPLAGGLAMSFGLLSVSGGLAVAFASSIGLYFSHKAFYIQDAIGTGQSPEEIESESLLDAYQGKLPWIVRLMGDRPQFPWSSFRGALAYGAFWFIACMVVLLFYQIGLASLHMAGH